jgi:hypothetical protein
MSSGKIANRFATQPAASASFVTIYLFTRVFRNAAFPARITFESPIESISHVPSISRIFAALDDGTVAELTEDAVLVRLFEAPTYIQGSVVYHPILRCLVDCGSIYDDSVSVGVRVDSNFFLLRLPFRMFAVDDATGDVFVLFGGSSGIKLLSTTTLQCSNVNIDAGPLVYSIFVSGGLLLLDHVVEGDNVISVYVYACDRKYRLLHRFQNESKVVRFDALSDRIYIEEPPDRIVVTDMRGTQVGSYDAQFDQRSDGVLMCCEIEADHHTARMREPISINFFVR